MRSRIAIAVVGLMLGACSLEPAYQRPAVAVPDAWREALAAAATAPAQRQWWQGFGDPQLLQLLDVAQHNSPDLQIAIDHFMAAHDELQIADARRYPVLGFNGAPTDPITTQLRVGNSGRLDVDSNIFELSLDASYEFDFWGRIRNSIVAADAQYQASRADAGTVWIGLQAAVAKTYVELRALDEQIGIVDARQQIEQEKLRLAELRLQAGRTGMQPVDEARRALAAAQLGAQRLQRARALGVATLALLLGQSPEQFELAPATLRASLHLQAPPEGLPASLLQRRPDVAAAEQRLRAAHAEVAVDHAALLPQVALTGKAGFVTGAVRGMADVGSTVLGIGPEIAWPLFDHGARKAQLDASRWQQDASLNDYRKTVLAAFADVEHALLDYQGAVQAAQHCAEDGQLLASELQREDAALAAGQISKLDQLSAREQLLDNALASVQAYRVQLDSLIALYQALGGGWSDADLPPPAAAAG